MKFFSIEGGFYKFICRFIDLVKLNMLWLLFSLPIVTIGASTVAAYSVALKMVDDEEGYVVKSFVKAFRENLKQGILAGIIFMVASYALYLDYEINRVSPEGSILLVVIGIVSLFFIVMAGIYTFPLLARYENSLIDTIQNSMEIARRYFAKTLLLLVVVAVEIIIFNFNSTLQIIGVIFGPAFMIFTIAAFAKRIFQEIEKEPGTTM